MAAKVKRGNGMCKGGVKVLLFCVKVYTNCEQPSAGYEGGGCLIK